MQITPLLAGVNLWASESTQTTATTISRRKGGRPVRTRRGPMMDGARPPEHRRAVSCGLGPVSIILRGRKMQQRDKQTEEQTNKQQVY